MTASSHKPVTSSGSSVGQAGPWSSLAWSISGALGALLLACLVLWRGVAVEKARLNTALAEAQRVLRAMPSPAPELLHLNEQLSIVTAQHDALQSFHSLIGSDAAYSGGQHDWGSIFRALLDYDARRTSIRTLFQNGDTLSVSGLALTQDDIAVYVDRLRGSSAFEQVDVELLEQVQQDFPAAPPATPTSLPVPSASPAAPITDGYEIDDFRPGPITPGEIQRHSFSPSADIDQVQFTGKAGQRYCILALPVSADSDPLLDVFVEGAVYSNDNCASQQVAPLSCLCPGGSLGAASAAMVELQMPATGDRVVQVRVRNQGAYGLNSWYLLSVSPQPQVVTAVLGDAYEPDDPTPRPLAVFEQQQHSFFPSGDVDRVLFGVRVGRLYEIRTYNLAPGVDTVISVDIGGHRFSSDNISPGDLASQVVFVSPMDGQATAMITNLGQYGAAGTYWLTLTEVVPTAAASPLPTTSPTSLVCEDPYEPDDVVRRFIGPGDQQLRTFCPAGDVDRVFFTALARRRYIVRTEPLGSGVNTVLIVTGPVRNCQPSSCQDGNASPGPFSSGSTVAFDATSSAEVTILVYNNGSFGAGQRYYVRVNEVGVVPDTPVPTPTVTASFTPGPTQTPTTPPTATLTPAPTHTASPPPTETPTQRPRRTRTVHPIPSATATPSQTGAPIMRLDPRGSWPVQESAPPPLTGRASGTNSRSKGLASLHQQQPGTIVRFVLACRLRDTEP